MVVGHICSAGLETDMLSKLYYSAFTGHNKEHSAGSSSWNSAKSTDILGDIILGRKPGLTHKVIWPSMHVRQDFCQTQAFAQIRKLVKSL